MKNTSKQFIKLIVFISVVLCFFNACIKPENVFDTEGLEMWESISSSVLGNNYVTCIYEDTSGNIWVGTSGGGLNRYDGINWTNYNTSNSFILSDYVYALTNNSIGDLYIGTALGFSVLRDGDWYKFSFFDGVEVTALNFDNSGNEIVGTYGYGFAVWETDHFGVYQDAVCTDCNNIRTIYKDKSGKIWMGTDGGLKQYTSNNWNVSNLYNTDNGLLTNSVYALEEDNDGNLWIGGFGDIGVNEYVIKYNNGSFTETSLKNDMPPQLLSIEYDIYGNMWFGGIGIGAVKYDGTMMRSFFETDGLPDNTVTAILSDTQGNIWIGTYEGGLGRYRQFLDK